MGRGPFISAYIIAACRSPVAPRGGALSTLSLHDLARPILQAALSYAGITPDMVDEVIVSNALGAGGNPARSVALAAGLPERIAGLVTIAAAPDFTEDSMWAGFSETQKQELAAGQVALPSDYGDPYIITKRLIEDGRDNLVLRTPLRLPFPVRFLQGTADADVDMAVALRLLAHAEGHDMRLALLKGGDHRFSDGPALSMIEGALSDVLTAI